MKKQSIFFLSNYNLVLTSFNPFHQLQKYSLTKLGLINFLKLIKNVTKTVQHYFIFSHCEITSTITFLVCNYNFTCACWTIVHIFSIFQNFSTYFFIHSSDEVERSVLWYRTCFLFVKNVKLFYFWNYLIYWDKTLGICRTLPIFFVVQFSDILRDQKGVRFYSWKGFSEIAVHRTSS